MSEIAMTNSPKLKSRLGFILVSAGSAIGLGNVWKFPYVAGQNGGGAFLLIYIVMLIIFGLPILAIELAIGRKAQQTSILMYDNINEKSKKRFGWLGRVGFVANVITMMYYIVIAAIVLIYFYKFCVGDFVQINPIDIPTNYQQVLSDPWPMIICAIGIVILSSFVCILGIQKGLENVTKILMLFLFALLFGLVIACCLLPNGVEGLKFFLIPDFKKVGEIGVFKVMFAALTQVFFTLGIGIGQMATFGSYTNKRHRLLGESLSILLLDTVVAFCAGLIIFPSCFSYGISVDQGPSLLFVTMTTVFSSFPAGRALGAIFFLFVSFAALSSVITSVETIISNMNGQFKISRSKSTFITGGILIVLCSICVFGFNYFKGFNVQGRLIFDMADFLVSNILMPIGALGMCLFAVYSFGWGFDNFLEEVNTGQGLKYPKWSKWHLRIALPIIILLVMVLGIYTHFGGTL